MTYENIRIEAEDGIGVLTLNRPHIYNAMDLKTWQEIYAGMREMEQDPDVRVIIVTGAGGKAFSSGGDIGGIQKGTAAEEMVSYIGDITFGICMLRKPVIAAIEGYALGGGCELAMACDIRIASKKSKFGQPELGLAIVPGNGGTQLLQRLVGMGKAKELIFTGDIIGAEEAERIGLVQKVVEDGAALDAAKEMARKIIKKGPAAVTLAKMAMNVGANTDLHSGLMLERYAQTAAFGTKDKMEGATAFLEKRPAVFEGK